MIDVVFASTLFAIIVASQIWGGAPEQRGGQVFGLIVILGIVRINSPQLRFAEIDSQGLFVDMLGFAAFTWISIFAVRIWPIWASSLQLLAVAAHMARAFEIPVHPVVYAVMRSAPTYFGALVLLIAVANYRRMIRRYGSMPSWREWSGWLNRIAPTKLRTDS